MAAKHSVTILRGQDAAARRHDVRDNAARSRIIEPRYTARCKLCHAEVEPVAEERYNGRLRIVFKCARHGSLGIPGVLWGMEG
jgi:hypothetical protein